MAATNSKPVHFMAVPQLGTHSLDSKHTSFDVEALKNDNILGKKISEARKTKKLSQKDLAEQLSSYNIKVSSGAISKWEKGDAQPNTYQFLALCQILQIKNVLEFFTGRVPEASDFSAELNQKGLNLLQLFKDTLVASGNYQPTSRRGERTIPYTPKLVKVYDIPAAAGPGSFLDSDDYQEVEFDSANVPEATEFGIRVIGNSMLPRYVPGQIVFVEQCQNLYDGEIGVFIYDGNAYIKQYLEQMPNEDEIEYYMTSEGVVCPKVVLFSLNRDCEQFDVHVSPEIGAIIVGRVLN